MRGILCPGRACSWQRCCMILGKSSGAWGRKAGARRSLEGMDREGRRDMGLREGHWIEGQGGGIQECGSQSGNSETSSGSKEQDVTVWSQQVSCFQAVGSWVQSWSEPSLSFIFPAPPSTSMRLHTWQMTVKTSSTQSMSSWTAALSYPRRRWRGKTCSNPLPPSRSCC